MRNRMVQQADGADDFSQWFAFILGVTWITDDQRCRGSLITALDTDDFAIFHEHLVHLRVQHVGTAVDSAQSGKCLRKTSETINWIKEWTVAISSDGV